MKKTLFIILTSVTILTSFAKACSNGIDGNETQLELVINCPSQDIKLGDEIPIVFTITNKGNEPYSYDFRSYDRSGRFPEFELIATDESGIVLPDPLMGGGISGGLGGETQKIKTGQSFTKTVALNLWALIETPGTYRVQGIYYPGASDSNGKEVVTISKPIEIIIHPRSEDEMIAYIEKLNDMLKSAETGDGYTKKQSQSDKRDHLIERLVYTRHPAIIPILVDMIYKNQGRNDMFYVKQAFMCYLPDKSKICDAILEQIEVRGLAPNILSSLLLIDCNADKVSSLIPMALDSNDLDMLSEGASAAARYPDDSYTEKLIELAQNPGSPAQMPAIHALANNRTEQGVQVLKKLLRNSKQYIREATCRSIISAYENTTGRPLKKDDFEDELEEFCREECEKHKHMQSLLNKSPSQN